MLSVLSPLALVERTIFFTDLERSTRMWEEQPEVMKTALQEHFGIIEHAVEAAGGRVFNHTGDGLVATFDAPEHALVAAAEAQRAIGAAAATPLGQLHSRMGIHSGECYEYEDRYSGQALNRCARLNAVGHAQQVLVSGGAVDRLGDELPAGIELVHLGEYWLRDISDAEQVYQLTGPGLRRDFPPIRSRSTTHERLPAVLDSFLGRRAEMDQLGRLLLAPETRLVTLTGEGGVGKTRLARELAGELSKYFRDGAHWLDLASTRPGDVTADLARLLGVPMSGSDDESVRELAAAISGQELLLVFDNCEMAIEDVRELARSIISHGRETTVLTTSRQPVELEGETRWTVRPLQVSPGPTHEPSEAVELFLDRAAHVAPRLRLDGTTSPVVEEIVNALDGVPLAIEQAAASLDVQSLDDLRLAIEEQRLSEVPGFDRVMTSIARTATLLDRAESDLLDDLVVFNGGFTVGAVAEICGDGNLTTAQAAASLANLRRLSFIRPDGGDGATRFRLLEPIRAFAGARRETPDALIERHRRYFVELALREGARYRHGDQRQPVVELDASWGDIRAAVTLTLARGHIVEVAEIVLAVHEYCLFSLVPDVYQWAARVKDDAGDQYFGAMTGISALGSWMRGSMDDALEQAMTALAADSTSELARFASRAAMNALAYLGDMEEAGKHYARLVRLLRDSPDEFWQVDGLASESIGLMQVGWQEPALERARAARALADRTGNQACLFWSFYALGFALASTNPQEARAALERSVHEADLVGSHWNANISRLELLLLRRRLSKTESHFTLDIEGAQIAWDLVRRFHRTRAHVQLWQVAIETAWMLAESGRFDEALELYAAVHSKPRMPRPDAADVDQQVVALLGDRPIPVSYLSDEQIISLCTEGLRELLGASSPRRG